MAAIEGLGAVYAPKDGKLLLILGGQGKGQQFGELTSFINQYVSQVLLIGEDGQQIEQHLRATKLSDDVALHQCQQRSLHIGNDAQVLRTAAAYPACFQ